MYDILKQLCSNNKWSFVYARQDFQNLFDEEPIANKPYFFLDPVQISSQFNTYNDVESEIHSGTFMVLMSSDIDDYDYEERYQKYIKPAIEITLNAIMEKISCDHRVTVNTWSSVEVINALDWNADGVIITYSITLE